MDIPSSDLFSLPQRDIDFDVVRRFVLAAEAADNLTESLTIEIKLEREKRATAKTVAAFANAVGGLLLLGVSGAARGEDRLVGVPLNDYDAVVNELQSLVGELPEIVSVAVPGASDRIIVVLRVNPDDFTLPVVVSGTVYKRIPGQSPVASRADIVNLVLSRESGSSVDTGIVLPLNSTVPMWSPHTDPPWELAIRSEVVLSNAIVDRPWLGTAARRVLEQTLHDKCPIPTQVMAQFDSRAYDRRFASWETIDARAAAVRLQCEETGSTHRFRPALQSSLRVQLDGRVLRVLLATGPKPTDDNKLVEVEDLHDLMVGSIFSVRVIANAITEEIDGGRPHRSLPVVGWMKRSGDLRIDQVLVCRRDWFIQVRPISAPLTTSPRLPKERGRWTVIFERVNDG